MKFPRFVSMFSRPRFRLVSNEYEGNRVFVSCSFPLCFRSFPVSGLIGRKRETSVCPKIEGAKFEKAFADLSC